MAGQYRMGANRRLALLGGLLLSTALIAPAMAQIEEVTVTAQKRSEDIQTVPIAVTAFTSQDLAAHQITQFKDLQFSTPSVTYTKTNFTGSDFSIRGIGTQVISGDAESGVAFNIDDVFYAAAPVDSGEFYDIERVEILRGPQSTLYGRGATGGSVGIFSHKPDLDAFEASADASYGNYNATELKAMVNVPIVTDQLAVRIAGDWVKHDGFSTNIYSGGGVDNHPDSKDIYSGRALVRWQPTDKTTIDFIAYYAHENDTRMRGQKQLCATDPSGVLGCLPGELSAEPVNLNATYFNIPVSQQALGTAFSAVYNAFYPSPPYPPGTGTAIAEGLGLFDLTQPFCATPTTCAPNNLVPTDPRKINSDFTPTLHGQSLAYTAEWKQQIAPWLTGNLVANWGRGAVNSQESYTNFPTPVFDQTKLLTSIGTVQNTLLGYVGAGLVPASYADFVNGPFAYVLNPSHFAPSTYPGVLPVSSFKNLGIIGGGTGILKYVPNELAYDQSNGESDQKEIDLRFNTDFDGPLNFMVAAFYLNTSSSGDYYVANDTLDYGQTLFGAILPPAEVAGILAGGGTPPGYLLQCLASGCIFGPPYYDNRTESSTLNSRAVYGEAYWTIVPDTLKLTVGARYTEDVKKDIGRILIFNGFVPVGMNSNDSAVNYLNATCQSDFDPNRPNANAGTPNCAAGQGQPFYDVRSAFDKLTGRVVLDYTPKLDFTDQTLIYASYSRGYKAGGANPGVQSGNLEGLPLTYGPEKIDAYELGTKNTLLGGTMQANGDIWYYNYGGYQVSAIIANTSINTNIAAKLWGSEAELLWAPTSHWQFNLNANYTHSAVGNAEQVDPRNPGAGDPNALVIKDGQLSTTNAQNCVYYYKGDGPFSSGNINTDFAALEAAIPTVFFLPSGGMHQLSGAGVPNVAYGTCYAGTDPSNPFYGLSVNNPAGVGALLGAYGFHTSDPSTGGTLTGEPVNLKGDHLANTPEVSFSIGAQYTADLDGGYTLVPRVDYYWQSNMWGRIFKDGADKIKAWGVLNAQIQLNSPDDGWYVQAFVRNAFNKDNMTGQYLTSSSSGLWTGAFYGDPRMYGIQVGAHF